MIELRWQGEITKEINEIEGNTAPDLVEKALKDIRLDL